MRWLCWILIPVTGLLLGIVDDTMYTPAWNWSLPWNLASAALDFGLAKFRDDLTLVTIERTGSQPMENEK